MIYRLSARTLSKPFTRTVLAIGTASYATYALNKTAHLDGPIDSIKEAASDLKDKVKARDPLKPESPAGIAGARTAHNPSTNMNHGQGGNSAASDAEQPDPLVAAQKDRQKKSKTPGKTDNDAGKKTAADGGGAGAKIASGHSKNSDGQRVPNHDDIKPSSGSASSNPKKSSKSSGSTEVEEGLGQAKKDAEKQEAFNEETGEINWDCPCLGGMADGPCGEDFKAAFSCFVYSKADPKGSECLDKFHAMQECFKEHKEIYGDLAADPGENAVQ